MAKKTTKRKIPKGYLYVDKDFRTVSIRDPKTGRMIGRKRVKGRGDSTAIRRVKKDFRKYGAGQIVGRTKPILVKRHKRASKKGKRHPVKRYNRKR